VTAPLHHGTGVVPSDFHPVSDSGVSEAVAGEAVCLAVIDRLDDLPLLIDTLLKKYVDSSKLIRALRFGSMHSPPAELFVAWKCERTGKPYRAVGY
jgi:hypothetical protein